MNGYDNYYFESYDGSYAQKEVDCDAVIYDAELKKSVRRKRIRIQKLDAFHDNEKRIMLVSESANDFIAEYNLNGHKEDLHFELGIGKEELASLFQMIIEKISV